MFPTGLITMSLMHVLIELIHHDPHIELPDHDVYLFYCLGVCRHYYESCYFPFTLVCTHF